MERISSMFFMLAIVVYYMPKLLKLKKIDYLKMHIVIGGISILAMIVALIQRIGNVGFLKYIGFSLIMILIGITGYLMKVRRIFFRALHIACVIVFFIYLYISIK